MFKRPTDEQKAESRRRALDQMRNNIKRQRRDDLLKQMLKQQQAIIAAQTRTTRRPFASGAYHNGELTVIGIDHGEPRPGTIEAITGDYFPESRRTVPKDDTLGSRIMDAVDERLAQNRAAMLDRLGIGA